MTVDPTRCPDCGEPLTGAPFCATCGLLLRGPVAARLWQVSNDLDRLGEVRAQILASLRPGGTANPAGGRERATSPVPPAAPAASPAAGAPWSTAPPVRPAQVAPGPAPAPPPASTGATAAAAHALATPPAAPSHRASAPRAYDWSPPPARPRKEWTPQRVQNLLLMTGTLLLVVAAVAFTAFTWGRLPIAARGAIMLAVTAATGWSAGWVHRRGLTASAEAIGLLTVLFAGVDLYAVHAANVFGLRATDLATYASVASGVLAVLAAAYARVLPVRSVRYAALGAAQLPLAITAARIDVGTFAQRGAVLAVQAAALGAAAYRLDGLALAARVSAAVNWTVAAALALFTGYVTTSLPDARFAALVLAAVGAVALLWPGDRTIPAGVATAFAVVAVIAPARLTLTAVQLPAAVAAAGLLAVVAAVAFDRAWRDGPLAVGAGAVGLALAAVSPWVAQALVQPFTWLGDPWRLAGDEPSRAVLSAVGTRWGGSVVTLGVVAVAALTAVVVAEVLGRRADARWPVVVLTSAAVLLVPLGFDWSFRAALVWYVVVGVGGLGASAAFRSLTVGISASVVLAIATAWSLAGEGPTLGVLLAVTVAYAAWAARYDTVREAAAGVAATGAAAFAAALTLSRGASVEQAGFVLAVTGCALAGVATLLGPRVRTVEPVAAVVYLLSFGFVVDDSGWAAWVLGAGAATAALMALRPERRWLAGPAAFLTASCTAATTAGYGLDLGPAGCAVAATACALAVAGVLLRLRDVQVVAVAAYALATAAAVTDPVWGAYALGAGALTAGALAVRDRVLTPVAAALAVACAGMSAYALGAPFDRTGFVVAVAAAVALAAGVLLGDERVEAVAGVAYAVAFGLAFTGIGWTAWTFAVGAVATGANAVRPARRRLAGPSAALTAACAAATAAAFGLAPAEVGFVVAATACAIVAAGALTRLGDVSLVGALAYAGGTLAAGDDMTWLSYALCLGALTAGVAAIRDRQLAPVSAALAVACSGTSAYALGAPPARVGVVVALASIAALAVGALLRGEVGDQLDLVGVLGYVVALGLAGPDPGWLSWVLLAGGVAALAEGLRPERRLLANWTAVVLFTAWAWDRLWLEDVRVPEAYAAPVAALLLVLGHLRRRRDPETPSWAAYGGGLAVAFLPTTYLVFTDPGVTRPVLLAVAGLVVLLAGVKERLQAPLTVGALALAIDAVVQLAPVAVALPKWATIGAAGLLVIAVGVTYEDRRRDVERLRESFDSMA